MSSTPSQPLSVCVYCGSSNTTNPAYIAAANAFGRLLAEAGVRLVYGGGGVGLMGATARGVHDAGGKVLGVMPTFLRSKEILYDDVETIVVTTMHERKMIMFEESDAFVVLPGGIGTLEEIVELLSWKRLGLHHKPIVFFSPGGFWDPFFALVEHTIAERLTPIGFSDSWRSVATIEEILPAIIEMGVTIETPEADAAVVRLT